MSRSLNRLRALAVRLLDPRTMERIIDPVLADIHMECADASRRGRVWKSRWTLIVGHLVLLKTVALCEAESAMRPFLGWPADDLTTLKHTFGVSVVAVAITTIVLEMPFFLRSPALALSDPISLLYLMPQAFVIAVPIGVTIGVFYGLRGRVASRRATHAVLASAIILSLVCLVTLAWILPWANQEFRLATFQRVSGDQVHGLVKGLNELTLGELRERINVEQHAGRAGWDPLLVYTYQQRWALSVATVILAAFALVLTQRIVTRWVAGLSALGTVLLYYVLLYNGRASVLESHLSAVAGAWLPNVLVALVFIGVVATSSRRAPRAGGSPPAPERGAISDRAAPSSSI